MRTSGKLKDGEPEGCPRGCWPHTGKGHFKTIFGNRQVKREGVGPSFGAGQIRLEQNQEKAPPNYDSVFISSVEEKGP